MTISHTFRAILLGYIKDEIITPKLEENDEDDEIWDIEEAFDPEQRVC